MGKASSAAIVSEIGDIEQLDSHIKLESYGGISPDTRGSAGKITTKGVTKIRNPHLSHCIRICSLHS